MKINEIEKHNIALFRKGDIIDGRENSFVYAQASPGSFEVVNYGDGYEVKTESGTYPLKECRLMVMTEVEIEEN